MSSITESETEVLYWAGICPETEKRQGRLGDTWYLDEVFIKIRGDLHYLWRAVDQDGDTIDILVQKRRNKAAAKRFFPQTIEEPAPAAMANDYRQTEELFGCAPGSNAFSYTQHRTVRKQPS